MRWRKPACTSAIFRYACLAFLFVGSEKENILYWRKKDMRFRLLFHFQSFQAHHLHFHQMIYIKFIYSKIPRQVSYTSNAGGKYCCFRFMPSTIRLLNPPPLSPLSLREGVGKSLFFQAKPPSPKSHPMSNSRAQKCLLCVLLICA